MNRSLMIRWALRVMILVCAGCSLDPNWVNRHELAKMETFTMCGIPEGQERLYGIRYMYWVPEIFFQPHCNHSRLQYYKQEDNTWIHGGIRGTELRIEGNLDGSDRRYNMNVDQMYQVFYEGLKSKKKFHNESRGERFSYALDRVVKNGMLCIRLETVLRNYYGRWEGNLKTGSSVARQGAVKNIDYYCWLADDNLNHYVKIGASTLSGFRIPDKDQERYYAHIKRTNRIPAEDDEYANAPLEYSVDLEKEVLDPVFETLTVRPVSDDIKQKLDAEWRATCESRMKTFETDYVEQEGPARYRRMYLENCGYAIN